MSIVRARATRGARGPVELDGYRVRCVGDDVGQAADDGLAGDGAVLVVVAEVGVELARHRQGVIAKSAVPGRITPFPGPLRKGMRLHEGMRRCLIAILMALALTFAVAGCGPPHVKVPRVPEQVRDFNNSDLNNIRKHAENEKYRHACYDDQGIPYSYDC